jgi:hypothetical protein
VGILLTKLEMVREFSMKRGKEGRNNDMFHLASWEISSWCVWEQLDTQVRSLKSNANLGMVEIIGWGNSKR